jgi:hypothetical protein
MRRALVLASLLALAPEASALDVPLAPYVQAQREGAVGVVEGRVMEERRRPEEPDLPLAGASVLLVPRSPELLATFQSIREGSRASAAAYTAAAPAMLKAKEDFELALWKAGAAELARTAGGGSEGRFRITDVPAGAWVLLATRSVRHSVPRAKTAKRDEVVFRLGPSVTAFQAVMIWLREIDVMGAGTVTVELTDRNMWFNGVVEERASSPRR